MKPIPFLSALALTTLVLALPFGAQAADTATTAPAVAPSAPVDKKAAKAAKADDLVSYAGVVSAVDKAKQTFALKDTSGERTFVVTAETKIKNTVTKADAKFDDIAVDAYVTGSYLKKGDTLEAHSVHLGKTAPVKGEKKAKKAAAAAAEATPAK